MTIGLRNQPVWVMSAAVAPVNSYWGALIGTQFTGSQAPDDWASTPNSGSDFYALCSGAKAMSVVHFGSGHWQNLDNSYVSFPTAQFNLARNAGCIPLYDWGSATNNPANVTSFKNTAITGGSQDSYISTFAAAAAAWGHPLFLRLDWEMSGNWFQFGSGAGNSQGNVDADFAPMWQHVHGLFVAAGASNVSWYWCPNWDCSDARSAVLYPGASYVDWVGCDGYNKNSPWTTFSGIFAGTYNYYTATLAPGKPYMIGEIGCTETGGDKAAWLTDMFTQLSGAFTGVRGLVWYERGDASPADSWIESSSASETAFAAGIDAARFTTNSYSALSTSPIPTP